MNTTNVEIFRNGIFALNTRCFGVVAEITIKKLYGLNDLNTILHDCFLWIISKYMGFPVMMPTSCQDT